MIWGECFDMYRYVKRFLDLVMAIILLVICFIPIIIITIAIKIEDGGPLFYKQERTGKNGKIFILYKIRSTPPQNDIHDFNKADVFTKVGKFVRKTSLDELGQLINILKGDMSFIGPRPWIPDYYEAMNEEQRHRCDVTPGITGLSQCKGRNNLSIFQKINYDLEYIHNFSFKQDIKIIFLTIKTVLSKDGVDAGKQTIHDEIELLKTQTIDLSEVKAKM